MEADRAFELKVLPPPPHVNLRRRRGDRGTLDARERQPTRSKPRFWTNKILDWGKSVLHVHHIEFSHAVILMLPLLL